MITQDRRDELIDAIGRGGETIRRNEATQLLSGALVIYDINDRPWFLDAPDSEPIPPQPEPIPALNNAETSTPRI